MSMRLTFPFAGSAGGSSAALTSTITQTAHGFSVGNWVRHNGTLYVVSEADVAADSDVDGVVQAVTDANNFVLQTGGPITTLSGLTAGLDYFLSPTVPGGITSTEPSTPGQVSKPVLHATSTTGGWVQNTRGLVIPAKATALFPVRLLLDATALATGEDFAGVTLPITSDLNGYSLTAAKWVIATVSSSGLPSLGLRKNSTEMLSTNVTIDANELTSETAATPAVIKSDGSQTVATSDLIHFDCDAAGTGAKGSFVYLTFTAP